MRPQSKTLIRECAETKELRGAAGIICNKTVSKTKRRDEEGPVEDNEELRIIMSGGGGVAKTSKAIRSLSRKQEIRQSSSEDKTSYYSHVVS